MSCVASDKPLNLSVPFFLHVVYTSEVNPGRQVVDAEAAILVHVQHVMHKFQGQELLIS